MDDRIRREVTLRRRIRVAQRVLYLSFPTWWFSVGLFVGAALSGGRPGLLFLFLTAMCLLAFGCIFGSLAVRMRAEGELARTLRP